MSNRPSQPHVIILPAHASTEDLQRAKLLAKCLGTLSNATSQTMKGRVKQLRRNPEWVALGVEGKEYTKSKKRFSKQRREERAEAYNRLKIEYGVSQFACVNTTQKHYRDSTWMSDHLDTRMVTALAKEIWTPVKQWLIGQAGEPRYSSSNQRTLISGNSQAAGLRFKDNRVMQTNLAIKRARKSNQPLGNKAFDMRVSWGGMSKTRAAYYQNHSENIKQIRLVLDKEKKQLHVHLVFDCPVYRSQEKIEQFAASIDKTVSFDLGPSTLALVSEDTGYSGVCKPSSKTEEAVKEERKYRRRQQRHLQRSRHNNNPDYYNTRRFAGADPEDGTIKPGKKQWVTSKEYQRTQKRIKRAYKKEHVLIRDYHQEVMDTVLTQGLNVITEKDTINQWQRDGYGKSVTKLAPGELRDRILREARIYGGETTELNTFITCQSQYCICGDKVKKPQWQREHCCQNSTCLLYNQKYHRDKFAALLGLWIVGASRKADETVDERRGIRKLLKQVFCTVEHRSAVIELCSVSSRDRNSKKAEGKPRRPLSSVNVRRKESGDHEKVYREHSPSPEGLSKPVCSANISDQEGRVIKNDAFDDKLEKEF